MVLVMVVAGCQSQSADRSASDAASTAQTTPGLPDTPQTETDTDTAAGEARSGTQQPSSVAMLEELLLFFPAKHPEGNWQPPELSFEDVWFTSEDGVELHGWYCPHEHPRAVILFAHGNAGNLSHRAPLLVDLHHKLRVSVMIFDYRGYGRSEGSPSVPGVIEDGRAARAALAEQAGVEEKDIVLMGRSLGGAVVAQLAGEAPARGLILESTFSSLRDVAAHHYPMFAWLVSRNRLNSVSAIGQFEGPLLQSHGDADRVVPYSLGRRLYEAANEPKRFVTIPGGDHNDPPTSRYYDELDLFLDSLP